MSNGTGNGSVAPSCPISHSQLPTNPRGTAPTRLPAIPIATDLPSLIRSVNIMRDILRNITTSLTINNTYLPRAPRQPKVYGDRTYNVSPYPDWYQVEHENESGYVGKDPKARAHVERLHKVVFRNNERDDDNLFKWLYKKPLTGRGGGNEPFEEDFFERLVRVKWKKKGKPKYYSVAWFWNVDILNSGATGVSSGCVPWDQVEGDIGNILWPPDTHCSWSAPRFRIFGSRPTAWVLNGEPSGTGGGNSNDHCMAGLGAIDGETYVIGESITGQIRATKLSEAKCWGGGPYPPPPILAYWSAFCRTTQRNESSQIGTVSVNAGGISGTTLKGKPLTKIRTEISLSPGAYGGIISVTFEDDDPDPDPTP